jgi:cell division protein FtsB
MSARATATSPASAQGKKEPPKGAAARGSSGLRLTPRATILGFIVFIAAIFAVAPARAYLDQRAQREQLATEVQQLQQQNADLQHQLDQLHDPVELERLARECLGMVDPGEIAIVPVEPGKAPTPPNCD